MKIWELWMSGPELLPVWRDQPKPQCLWPHLHVYLVDLRLG